MMAGPAAVLAFASRSATDAGSHATAWALLVKFDAKGVVCDAASAKPAIAVHQAG